jgi:hypothetical protein
LQENLCSPLQEPSFARTFFLLSVAREPLTSSAGARIGPKVFCCPPLQKNLCSPLQEPSFARTFFLLSFAREPLTSFARVLIGPKVFCYPPLQENLCLLCPHFPESFFSKLHNLIRITGCCILNLCNIFAENACTDSNPPRRRLIFETVPPQSSSL